MSVLKEKVVIIIPTYNEGLVIEETIHQVFANTNALKEMDVELLIFDSASPDNTQESVRALLSQYHPKLHLQSEAKKTGLGSAYLQAMRYALDVLRADVIVEFDADLSHQPKYLIPMLLRLTTCDVVIGSRYVKGGGIPDDWGIHRKFLSVLGNYVARIVLTMRYRDFTSGFRATRSHILRKIIPDRFLSQQYAYKLHLLWLLHKQKADIQEIPIQFVDRTQGVSKLPANSIKDSLRVIFTLRYREASRYLKMCLVGLSGAGLQFLIYNILRLHCPPIYAIKISTLMAIINNFILNHRFTFKQSLPALGFKKNMQRFSIFVLYYIAIIQLQSFCLDMGIKHLGAGRVHESLLLIAIIGFSSLLNYFVSSRFIWRNSASVSSC